MLSSWGVFGGGRIIRSVLMVAFDVVGGGVGDLGGIEAWGNGAGAVCEVEGTGGGRDRKRAG